jgi:hypothetical protein
MIRRRHKDFRLHDEGAYLLLRPTNEVAKAWVDEHLGQDNPVSPYVAIDHHEADDVILGIRADGLTI